MVSGKWSIIHYQLSIINFFVPLCNENFNLIHDK